MGGGGVQTQTSQAEGKQKLSWDTEVLHLLGLGYFLGRLPGMEQSRQEESWVSIRSDWLDHREEGLQLLLSSLSAGQCATVSRCS